MPKTDKYTRDFREFLDWKETCMKDSEEVGYADASGNRKKIYHKDTNSVNVYETVKKTPETKIKDVDRQIKLRLSDVF